MKEKQNEIDETCMLLTELANKLPRRYSCNKRHCISK